MLAWLLCSAAAAQPSSVLPAEVQAALAAAKLPIATTFVTRHLG